MWLILFVCLFVVVVFYLFGGGEVIPEKKQYHSYQIRTVAPPKTMNILE